MSRLLQILFFNLTPLFVLFSMSIFTHNGTECYLIIYYGDINRLFYGYICIWVEEKCERKETKEKRKWSFMLGKLRFFLLLIIFYLYDYLQQFWKRKCKGNNF
ncbi:hypothetical protein QBC38DRAFT_477949 [Podospora fimiseda]|uniref:Uncharacterized protein n=1 Tax=Podospora fimiseda TaxID=252190 RepID=A0AAN7GYT9_9PEZI|nr:hypothetical protein QBC38DRAFT_477949 [Podospora fimiseda]